MLKFKQDKGKRKKYKRDYFPVNEGGYPKTLLIEYESNDQSEEVYYVYDGRNEQYKYEKGLIYKSITNELMEVIKWLTSFLQTFDLEYMKNLHEKFTKLFKMAIKCDPEKISVEFNSALINFYIAYERFEEEKKVKDHIEEHRNDKVKDEITLQCGHIINPKKNNLENDVMCKTCYRVLDNEELVSFAIHFEEVLKKPYSKDKCMFCGAEEINVIHSNHSCCKECMAYYKEGIYGTPLNENVIKKVKFIKCPARDCKFRYCL